MRRAPSHLALAYRMAPHSHATMPVLEEWHVGRNRPHACGMPGCIAQLVTKTHLEARLCAAHIKCPAVLRGGVPQRWCACCHRFHTLGAFSASARCAPASCWNCTGHPHYCCICLLTSTCSCLCRRHSTAVVRQGHLECNTMRLCMRTVRQRVLDSSSCSLGKRKKKNKA